MRLAALLEEPPPTDGVGARFGDADRVVRAVLETLAESLPPSCVVRLMQALPPEVAVHLRGDVGASHGAPFVDRVRARCDDSVSASGEPIESAIGLVLRGLATRLPVADVERMRGALGQSFDRYFEPSA
ncbi:MAG: DUF2267 domain-containing protein [Planctomycetota bacterium]